MDLKQKTPSGAHVLVVEDELDLQELLALNIQRAGFSVDTASDGKQALSKAREKSPDLVVLDVMLPGMLGTEVARALRDDPRTARASILMLTAKAQEVDQVAGLEGGADDYVTKPFSMKVVIARLQALLRRNPPTPSDAPPLSFGSIEANLQSHRVTVDGAELQLTLTEYKLLLAMLGSPEKVLTRNDLISRVMGPGIVITPRTIDVHVAALRRKLGAAGSMIRTSRGIGYSLTASGSDSSDPESAEG